VGMENTISGTTTTTTTTTMQSWILSDQSLIHKSVH
jgi:hypothetical protein